jgi:gamma-glutamylcyclotransferase (GGCT)/AIG2-like uncharacterized protein YtfP
MSQIVQTSPCALSNRVFVYGTLKEGYRLHGALQGAGKISNARIKGYMLHTGGYPAVILASNGPWVHGEIYTINDPILAHLDIVEGAPNYYHRVLIYATNHGPVWTYVWPLDRISDRGDNCTIIPDGNWRGSATPQMQYIRFLNENPTLSAPDKPFAVWDQTIGATVIKQPWYTGESGNIVVTNTNSYTPKRSNEITQPPSPEPLVPEEASQQLDGLEVKWL